MASSSKVMGSCRIFSAQPEYERTAPPRSRRSGAISSSCSRAIFTNNSCKRPGPVRLVCVLGFGSVQRLPRPASGTLGPPLQDRTVHWMRPPRRACARSRRACRPHARRAPRQRSARCGRAHSDSIGRRPYCDADVSVIRHRCERVRMNRLPRAIAGLDMATSSSELVAITRNRFSASST